MCHDKVVDLDTHPLTEQVEQKEIERIMSMSEEELRAELIAEGENPDTVVTRVREIIRSALAQTE